MLLVGDSAHRADPPATHNVATLNPVGFLTSRRPPCFPGSLDCFLPQISTTTGESFLRGLRRTKSVPAGGPAGIELPMPWMLEMEHGGLREPTARIRETRPNSECPLAFLAGYMSIAQYGTAFPRSKVSANSTLPPRGCHSLVAMMLNPDMSLGQQSTRDGVLLGSLKIAGLPRGNW